MTDPATKETPATEGGNGKKPAANAKRAEKATPADEVELTKADVAKLIGGTVVVPGPVDKKGKWKPVERKITGDDILGFRVDGDTVRATTVDGRKVEASLR
jgi:hypothetical protein